MSLYFLCRKFKLLNTFSRRKRFSTLAVTYTFSFILYLLFIYDLSVVLATGNPEYSTHLATDYIPLLQMFSCYTLLYSMLSSWAVSNHLMLVLSLIAGAIVAVTLTARLSLNLALIGFYPETLSEAYSLIFISDIMDWIAKYINAPK